MSEATATRTDDMLSNRWQTVLAWRAPLVLVAVGVVTGPRTRTALWTIAFAVMGGACLFNARRCGRRRCYFTGPVYLAGGMASLAHGMGWLLLGSRGWTWIFVVELVAILLLRRLPEVLSGTYAGRNPSAAD